MRAATEAQLDRSISRRQRERQLHRVWRKIIYWQSRRKKAAVSHRKKTLRVLHAKGIHLWMLVKCFGKQLAL